MHVRLSKSEIKMFNPTIKHNKKFQQSISCVEKTFLSFGFSYKFSCDRITFQAERGHPTLLEGLICWFTTGARTLIWMNGWKMQLRYDCLVLSVWDLFDPYIHNLSLCLSFQEERRSKRDETIGDDLFRWGLVFCKMCSNLVKPLQLP